MYTQVEIDQLELDWKTNPRWKGVLRPYTAEQVIRLRGSLQLSFTLARMGAERLWRLFETEPFVRALGAMSGNQAVQMVQAGLKSIYVSGWQVAGDNNVALETYPDQSLYPVNSVPAMIRRINNAMMRADQIQHMDNVEEFDYFVPIVADAEAGFGGPLNAYELIKSMIREGAAAIHLEDQLSSLKKCGHMGGKVLVPANVFIQKLITARLAADVLNVPTVIISRTDADSANLIRSDSHPVDQPFLTGERSYEGYYYLNGGVDYAIARSLEFAPYADLIWCETARPDLGEAREFAQGIHEKYPGKWLAYNCSPSFNWRRHLGESEVMNFQEKLGELGYKYQFVTLAGFHTLNASIFELAQAYATQGMGAYSRFQQHEFELENHYGYKAIKHQSFVGAGYFDEVLMAVSEGQSTTTAMKGSTEEEQFQQHIYREEIVPIDEKKKRK
jgi:isocitrate lyase